MAATNISQQERRRDEGGLSPDQVFDLVLGQHRPTTEPSKTEVATFEGGQVVKEEAARPPRVEVGEPTVVEPTAVEPQEPEVPAAVEEADEKITATVEALPEVAEEEKKEEQEIQESPADTVGENATSTYHGLRQGNTPTNASESDEAEKKIWSPLGEQN